MLYKFIVFLHVIFVFGYLLSHGVSAGVAFALKKERNIQRIRDLLDLSAASYPATTYSMYAFLLFGVIAAFQGGWWRFGWVWTSLILGILIVVLMAVFGAGIYGEARKAAGIRYNFKGKWFAPEPAKSDEEVFMLLAKANPTLLTVIGYGGFAIITWLMTAKPY
ncbi:MAG: hypothetical protein HY863_18685 [Chloroflexi bacterium]|nr:hypothetical protein [Chloroflexota bacterium]